ncbi:MAG: hypothetical protein BWK76_06990 [Desulfobulbaceae bacterium A2]|nr:MAG: hypothetical protein BWK76_06990 [Desulfobulbaceae bacterium A2]
MYIANYMTIAPMSITPDTLLPQARELLLSRNFRHLPVVDDNDRLLGIVTDRDIRSAYPSSLSSDEERRRILEAIAATPISRVMATELTTLTPTATLDDALMVFERRRVGAIPVVDNDGLLVGIFSIGDLLQAYGTAFGLGEKGSSLVEIRDKEGPETLECLIRVLGEQGISFTRLVRSLKERIIHVRVNTYNIRQLHKSLTAAGLEVVPVPGRGQ